MGIVEAGAVPGEATPERAARAGALPLWRGAVWLAANVEEILCAALLVVLVGSVSSAVFFRYVLDAPLSWPEEVSRFVMVWLTFVGSALATKHKGHVLVDFAVLFLPERARLAMAVLVNLVLLAFLALFFSLSVQIVRKMWVAVSPALSINMGHVYLALPLGSLLMIVHLARQTLGLARAGAAAWRR